MCLLDLTAATESGEEFKLPRVWLRGNTQLFIK